MGLGPNKTRHGRAAFLLAGSLLLAGIGAAAFALTSDGGRKGDDRGGAVAAGSAKGLRLQVVPLTRRVEPGQSTRFALRIKRPGRGKVRLRLLGPLPRGLAVSLPRMTRKRRAVLVVGTAGVRSGGHRLRLEARSGRRRAIAAANLVIHLPRQGTADFTIAGDLEGELSPGAGSGIDLVLTNPGQDAITITSLGVSIEQIAAPSADEGHPCGTADFAIEQFSGAYGFSLGASSSASLSDLGFTPAQWPRVTMLDRPVNQDGCKHAVLDFQYTGTATGGSP